VNRTRSACTRRRAGTPPEPEVVSGVGRSRCPFPVETVRSSRRVGCTLHRFSRVARPVPAPDSRPIPARFRRPLESINAARTAGRRGRRKYEAECRSYGQDAAAFDERRYYISRPVRHPRAAYVLLLIMATSTARDMNGGS